MKSTHKSILALILLWLNPVYANEDINRVFEERCFVQEYEGFSSNTYEDTNGKKVIGYGHTLKKQSRDLEINQKQASALLVKDIIGIESFIKQHVAAPLSQGQTEALVSLIYNWGRTNFLRSKGFFFLNASNYDQAAIEFFSKEHGVVYVNGKFSEGLYARRQAELGLWNDNN